MPHLKISIKAIFLSFAVIFFYSLFSIILGRRKQSDRLFKEKGRKGHRGNEGHVLIRKQVINDVQSFRSLNGPFRLMMNVPIKDTSASISVATDGKSFYVASPKGSLKTYDSVGNIKTNWTSWISGSSYCGSDYCDVLKYAEVACGADSQIAIAWRGYRGGQYLLVQSYYNGGFFGPPSVVDSIAPGGYFRHEDLKFISNGNLIISYYRVSRNNEGAQLFAYNLDRYNLGKTQVKGVGSTFSSIYSIPVGFGVAYVGVKGSYHLIEYDYENQIVNQGQFSRQVLNKNMGPHANELGGNQLNTNNILFAWNDGGQIYVRTYFDDFWLNKTAITRAENYQNINVVGLGDSYFITYDNASHIFGQWLTQMGDKIGPRVTLSHSVNNSELASVTKETTSNRLMVAWQEKMSDTLYSFWGNIFKLRLELKTANHYEYSKNKPYTFTDLYIPQTIYMAEYNYPINVTFVMSDPDAGDLSISTVDNITSTFSKGRWNVVATWPIINQFIKFKFIPSQGYTGGFNISVYLSGDSTRSNRTSFHVFGPIIRVNDNTEKLIVGLLGSFALAGLTTGITFWRCRVNSDRRKYKAQHTLANLLCKKMKLAGLGDFQSQLGRVFVQAVEALSERFARELDLALDEMSVEKQNEFSDFLVIAIEQNIVVDKRKFFGTKFDISQLHSKSDRLVNSVKRQIEDEGWVAGNKKVVEKFEDDEMTDVTAPNVRTPLLVQKC